MRAFGEIVEKILKNKWDWKKDREKVEGCIVFWNGY